MWKIHRDENGPTTCENPRGAGFLENHLFSFVGLITKTLPNLFNPGKRHGTIQLMDELGM